MAEIINGYQLEAPLKTDNSGFSKWGFASLNEKNYFIKEFLSPVYPVDEKLLGEELTQKRKAACENYVNEKRALFAAINKASDGNIVHIEHFFRYGSKYYIVMEKIEPVSRSEVLSLPLTQKVFLCMILAHAVSSLHQAGLVHADLKLDNVIFYKTKDHLIGAKIVDLDTCFWEANPPKSEEEITGDQIYMAPETFLLLAEEEGTLTRKIDVYAMGIIFHQILAGTLPGFDSNKYQYPYEALLNGEELRTDSGHGEWISGLLREMLKRGPMDRLSMELVCVQLRHLYRKLTGASNEDASYAEKASHSERTFDSSDISGKKKADKSFFRCAGEDDL